MRGEKLSGWRRLAAAAWTEPLDPQVYASLDLDAAPVVGFMERAREQGHRITPTCIVGRAAAHALAAVPSANIRIAGGRMYRNESVNIFFVTATDGGRSLSGVRIDQAEKKSARELSVELERRSAELKSGSDPVFARARRLMDMTPWPLLKLTLRLASWAAGARAWTVRPLGITATPFGSWMITSVGMFGLPSGFAPLSRLYRIPLLIVVGEICEKPMAVDGRVEARSILPLTITFDHRYYDAWAMAELVKPFRDYMANPASFESST